MPAKEIENLEERRPDLPAHPPNFGPGRKLPGLPRSLGMFLAATLVLGICFSAPLFNLVRFAVRSDLYSYVVLMPLVSLYMVWLKREQLQFGGAPFPKSAAVFWIAGVAVLAGHWLAGHSRTPLTAEDHLAFTTLSFLLLLAGNGCCFLGRGILRVCAFPLGLLVFMIPWPTFMQESIVRFLQYGSALAAHALFSLTGTVFDRQGLIFYLPGIPLEVAPECSGVHSSLILLITSLLAGSLFLRSPWKRTVLAIAVIPLGLLRNGFRIFTIGQLCIHIGPQMIDSPIHTKGGPIFFVLSLVPFFLLLLALQRSDRAGREARPKTHGS
jgi:exosortase C (VPDSG-CTERM-specific)